jgi:hypothetical protein
MFAITTIYLAVGASGVWNTRMGVRLWEAIKERGDYH